jgi:hypothetical protein
VGLVACIRVIERLVWGLEPFFLNVVRKVDYGDLGRKILYIPTVWAAPLIGLKLIPARSL